MSIRVLYSTESFLHRNGGETGKGCERSFDCLDAAKDAPFPDGCTFAYIPMDDEFLVHHSTMFGWERHKEV